MQNQVLFLQIVRVASRTTWFAEISVPLAMELLMLNLQLFSCIFDYSVRALFAVSATRGYPQRIFAYHGLRC